MQEPRHRLTQLDARVRVPRAAMTAGQLMERDLGAERGDVTCGQSCPGTARCATNASVNIGAQFTYSRHQHRPDDLLRSTGRSAPASARRAHRQRYTSRRRPGRPMSRPRPSRCWPPPRRRGGSTISSVGVLQRHDPDRLRRQRGTLLGQLDRRGGRAATRLTAVATDSLGYERRNSAPVGMITVASGSEHAPPARRR